MKHLHARRRTMCRSRLDVREVTHDKRHIKTFSIFNRRLYVVLGLVEDVWESVVLACY